MTSFITSPDKAGARRIAFWVLRILLALAFIGAGIFKLSGNPAAIEEFAHVGLGQWFRYFTAAVEIAGAVLLLLPRTIALGALLMGTICVGAFFAQLFALQGDVFHTIVLGAIFVAIAWYYRSQLGIHVSTDRTRTS
ncbi:DoxX family protein [Mesorhizobium sp. DCY119]|uniref:DoxX family protein n=1 Tax=Mesorhizobium sp. DCY119 TaxID=2108445 RepID=UPI000E768084|nr:DoxX family protein [Mesorhizobium sp. DCY119]RJG40499.1 DoxX family protein [Mesorhizobium sp. DCY119]